jgi:hypothetical protein
LFVIVSAIGTLTTQTIGFIHEPHISGPAWGENPRPPA